ncbi:hypothetical protein THAOC_06857 [Thalassiosira oceanica]|uniref:Uncharacterized protein n=1 Tax=Thalassiosira oceanica TaxID=159749 RepID=K0T3M5_THAOC|nr:hypothetical protein THAOC_06857 [Thalassiosira oceanica]|eukprot:EJK71679.1 hypothetical protein THAOC_06857 [Thalassiosira oceanica]
MEGIRLRRCEADGPIPQIPAVWADVFGSFIVGFEVGKARLSNGRRRPLAALHDGHEKADTILWRRFRSGPIIIANEAKRCVGSRLLALLGGILSGRAGRDNFLRDWNRVKQSPLGVLEQRGIPAKIEFFDNPLAAENLAVETSNAPSSTPQCLLDPPSPIPSSSGDPCGPSYLQIGSLGQCLPIGHDAGAQNVEHPRGDHGAAGNLSYVSGGRIDEVYRRTQDVSATGHGHLLDENDLKAKQDDVNTKQIPEPVANALSSRGPRERERDQTTAEIH